MTADDKKIKRVLQKQLQLKTSACLCLLNTAAAQNSCLVYSDSILYRFTPEDEKWQEFELPKTFAICSHRKRLTNTGTEK